MRRVVITGMGIYSCIGKNQDEVKDSLFQGRSGIGIDPARKEMGYFSALTGLVERPDLKKLLDRKKRHSLAEQGEYAYMATLQAFRQAQIDEEFLLDHEVGILYGNDSSAAPVIEAIDVIRAKKNTAMVGSGSIFQRFTRHRHGVYAHQIRTSGLHSVRRSTRGKSLLRG